eukprot:m.25850 g.25850  ORF g.25850 m.25850 type:complete len:842 (+) comp7743_c0_seq2:81-2606(+)
MALYGIIPCSFVLLFLGGISTVTSRNKAGWHDGRLVKALVDDVLGPSSTRCNVGTAPHGKTFFNYTFYSNKDLSQWDPMAQPFEEAAFLAEMGHVDKNPNKSWTMRISTGGGLMSFIGAYGEVMPPQYHALGPFVDEVWQNVAVSQSLNKPDNAYFIHQAGTYQKDDGLKEEPFFSPTVAVHCEGRACYVAAWGQHAHVPTKFESKMMYYNRYQDCGDGVMEVTTAFQNDATTDKEHLDYLNVPWGGVRPSVMRDWVFPTKTGGHEVAHKQYSWGSTGEVQAIRDTTSFGGYTTFAERLSHPGEDDDQTPCGDGSGSIVDCNKPGAIKLKVHFASSNPCALSGGHTKAVGLDVVACRIRQSVRINDGLKQPVTLQFSSKTSPNVTFSFDFIGVHHWSINGVKMFMYLKNASAQLKTMKVPAGNHEWNMRAVIEKGKPWDDNLALSFVHGNHRDQVGVRRPARVRIGTTSVKRDFTVYTQNKFPTIRPTHTYVSRQYVVTGSLKGMDVIAKKYVGEAREALTSAGHFKHNHKVNLYSPATDTSLFATAIDDATCGHDTVLRCAGVTVPRPGYKSLYHITCGNASYVGFDRYYLAPKSESADHIRRPWVCQGQDRKYRPTWVLLGFFPKGDCTDLENASYIPDGCLQFSSTSTTSSTTSTTISETTTETATSSSTSSTTSRSSTTSSSASSSSASSTSLSTLSSSTKTTISTTSSTISSSSSTTSYSVSMTTGTKTSTSTSSWTISTVSVSSTAVSATSNQNTSLSSEGSSESLSTGALAGIMIAVLLLMLLLIGLTMMRSKHATNSDMLLTTAKVQQGLTLNPVYETSPENVQITYGVEIET